MKARYTINNPRRDRCLAYARAKHRANNPDTNPYAWVVCRTRPFTHKETGQLVSPTPVLACATWAEREHLIRRLTTEGYNYFTRFCDVGGRFALMYGNADWVAPGQIHIG